MKKISIRLKITLWYFFIILCVTGITVYAVLMISRGVWRKSIKDNLIQAVTENVDEVHYLNAEDSLSSITKYDYYLSYDGGLLEINEDFMDEVNEIYVSLNTEEGELLYGENPIITSTRSLAFENSVIQSIESDGIEYFVFDRNLSVQGLPELWVRGIVSEEQGDINLSGTLDSLAIALPAIFLIALIGGYIITGRLLGPIHKITQSVDQIREDGDLTRRIEVGNGKDELTQLGNKFNELFDSVNKSFEAEKQFTSDASHELRTPMSVILAQTELALEKDRTPKEYRQALERIRRQGKKMDRLIEDMLDVSRLERRTDHYPLQQMDFSQLTLSICEDMQLIRDKGITLEYHIEENVMVTGNTQLLSRMIVNLITNAYRYGNENGHILVALTKENNMVSLRVEDDGIGIAEEDQEKIFQRFYQVDASRGQAGNGMGLAMVSEIVKYHEGNIRLTSSPGKGSVFTVSLLENFEENNNSNNSLIFH